MKNNEKLNLEYVQVLIDEIEYNNDLKEEAEEELILINEEMKFFSSLYSDFNNALRQKQTDLKNYQQELKEINDKQIRLDGRISKKDSERKKYLEESIKKLALEINTDKENRLEAKKSSKEVLDKNPNQKVTQKISEINDNIISKTEEIIEIYNTCVEQVNEIENKIKNKKESIKKAVENNDDDLLEGLSIELNELIKDRNKFAFRYKDIIKLIENKIDTIKLGDTKVEKVENNNDKTNQESKANDELLTQKEIEKIALENALKRANEQKNNETVVNEETVEKEEEKNKNDENNETVELNEELENNTEEIEKANEKLENLEKELEQEKNNNNSDIINNNELNEKMARAVEIAKERDNTVYVKPEIDENIIFRDESRIDEEHRNWMSYANAYNTGNVGEIKEVQEQKNKTENIKENLINAKNNLASIKNKVASTKVAGTISNKFGKIKNIDKKDLKDKLKNKIKQGTLKIKAGIIEYFDENLDNYHEEEQNQSKGR